MLLDARGELLGYFVAMDGVDEMHLLNITVAPAHQHRGHARFMLDALVALCRARGAQQLWLEVRASNPRAQAIYQRCGFAQVGVRKGYYPAPQGQREDAVVMSLEIDDAGSASMRWTERQRAMLGEMGIRVWETPRPAPRAGAGRRTRRAARGTRPSRRGAAGRRRAAAARRAPATASRAMDWPALRDAVAGCTACKLCQGRTPDGVRRRQRSARTG